MKFLHQTVEAQRGEIIEVEIDKPTKVKFLTGRNLKAYKMGKTHTYFGGLFDESPVRFVVPFDGKWTIVVEKGSYKAPIDVHAACRLMQPNPHVTSTIAIDAPPHVREAALNGETRDFNSHRAELSFAARSEG